MCTLKSPVTNYGMAHKARLSLPLLSLLWLISGVSEVAAQAFSATVSAKSVAVNGRLEVTFTLTNAEGNVANFAPPDFSEWTVLSGPAQSTNMQIINGAVSRSQGFTYILQPKKQGTLTIGAATIQVGGKTLSTNSIKVSVTDKPAGGSSGGGSQDASAFIEENAFIRTEISKKKAFQGEKIVVKYKLYTRIQLFNMTLESAPSFTGFWMEEQDVDQNRGFQPEVLDGVRYNALDLKHYILYPQKSGELEIEPLSIKAVARLQVQGGGRQSVFDDFFGRTQDFPHILRSRKETISVGGLPAGAPPSFYGAVGKYSLTVKSNKEQTDAGDPFTITITISGSGNLKTVQPPKLDLPPTFEVYDPKVKETGGIASGSRIYDYLVISRVPGTYNVPPVEFSYFDQSSGSYKTLRSEPFSIEVTGTAVAGGSGGASTAPVAATKRGLSLLGSDIRFIKTSAALTSQSEPFFGGVLFWLLIAAPLAMPFLILVVRKNSGKEDIITPRKAASIALKKIKEAEPKARQGEHSAAVNHVRTAVEYYLEHGVGLPPAEMTKERILSLAAEKDLPDDLLRRLVEALERCELALYAPSAPGADISSLARDCSTIIEEMSNVAKSVNA